MSWPKVQRRIAQLIHEDRFFTPIEVLRLSEIAAEEIQSEQNEPEAASSVDEMLAYAEQAAAQDAVEPYERFSLIETETGYAIWDDLRGIHERMASRKLLGRNPKGSIRKRDCRVAGCGTGKAAAAGV